MNFKPLGDRVLAQVIEREEKTESGIVLPDTAKERPQTAEIIAAGDGDEVKVKKGDTIVFAKYAGTEIKLDGDDYMILDAEDVLGVVED